MLLSQINTKYAIVVSNSPVIGYSEIHNSAGMFFRSMVGSSPITAELAFMNMILGIGLIFSVLDWRKYNINANIVTLYVFISMTVMLLTANRSTVFLSIASVGIILLSRGIVLRKQHINMVLVFAIATVIILFFPNLVGLKALTGRFSELNLDSVTLQSVESGESINRDTAFELGKLMLRRENWMIGYGWSTNYYNRVAWFGSSQQLRATPHSLYLALPMLFGWLGSLAFLFLVFRPITTAITSAVKNFDQENRHISITLAIINSAIIINQIKQEFVSEANYFFIMMVWLGISTSIIRYGLSDENKYLTS